MDKQGSVYDENGDRNSFPVKLGDCLEELVRFSLSYRSHHLNLSSQFCSTLLKDDPTYPSSSHSQSQPHGTCIQFCFVCFQLKMFSLCVYPRITVQILESNSQPNVYASFNSFCRFFGRSATVSLIQASGFSSVEVY